MTGEALAKSLTTLVDLRGREVDRLAAKMAEKEAMRQRYQSNLDRMRSLCNGQSAQGAVPASMWLNQAGYKQALLQMVDQHKEDLTLHEADMAVTQTALTAVSRKHEVLDQVRTRQVRRLQVEQGRIDQRRQDDLASQVWLRGQP